MSSYEKHVRDALEDAGYNRDYYDQISPERRLRIERVDSDTREYMRHINKRAAEALAALRDWKPKAEAGFEEWTQSGSEISLENAFLAGRLAGIPPELLKKCIAAMTVLEHHWRDRGDGRQAEHYADARKQLEGL